MSLWVTSYELSRTIFFGKTFDQNKEEKLTLWSYQEVIPFLYKNGNASPTSSYLLRRRRTVPRTSMASFSVRFLCPQPLLSSESSSKPKRFVLAAAQVDTDRIEPRVEDRDGFFVLKEEFWKGINPHEKVKIEKEPMKLFMENGIKELSKMTMEEIEKDKTSKDDIDVRLKWLGLFHRRKHQYIWYVHDKAEATKWHNNECTDTVPRKCD